EETLALVPIPASPLTVMLNFRQRDQDSAGDVSLLVANALLGTKSPIQIDTDPNTDDLVSLPIAQSLERAPHQVSSDNQNLISPRVASTVQAADPQRAVVPLRAMHRTFGPLSRRRRGGHRLARHNAKHRLRSGRRCSCRSVAERRRGRAALRSPTGVLD